MTNYPRKVVLDRQQITALIEREKNGEAFPILASEIGVKPESLQFAFVEYQTNIKADLFIFKYGQLL